MANVEGWHVKPLSKLLSLTIDYRGRTPKKLGMEWGGGDIPALSANNVEMGRINFAKECYFGSEKLYRKWMVKGDARPGDVVLTTEAPLGNVAQIPDGQRYLLSQRTILLRVNNIELCNGYLFHYLTSESFQKLMRQQSSGTTATGIQRAKLETLPVKFPVSIKEQVKIAEILSTVDRAIEQTETLIAKQQRIKTGLMQDLLSRGIDEHGNLRTEQTHKFKDSPLGRIPVEWDVRKIGDVFDIQLGKMLSQKATEGHAPFYYLGNKNVQWDQVDASDLQMMDFDERERQKFDLKQNDILVCEGGEVGRTTIWRNEIANCHFQKAIHRLRTIDNQYLPSLFPRFMKWATRKGLLSDYTSQTSIAHLTQEKLAAVPIIIQSLSEQHRLNAAADQIDDYLSSQTVLLTKLRLIKTALMQDLLTGKKRVLIWTSNIGTNI